MLGGVAQVEKHAFSHQDEVHVIKSPAGTYYLKTAPSLRAERENIQKVQPYILVPRIIGFCRIGGADHLLMSEVPGKNLAELMPDWPPESIIKEFAAATREFHALDARRLFGDAPVEAVVLHGDMSMPNV